MLTYQTKGNDMVKNIPAEYQSLDQWAHNHKLAFKVETTSTETLLWMSDAIDGHLRAECVCITPEDVTWLGYRFRLKKNEQFLDKFLKLKSYPSCDWIGHNCYHNTVHLPTYHKVISTQWNNVDGQVFVLNNKTDIITEKYLEKQGCTMLWSTPQYAPEIKYRAVFVPDTLHVV